MNFLEDFDILTRHWETWTTLVVLLFILCFGLPLVANRLKSRRLTERQHARLTQVVFAYLRSPEELAQGWVTDISRGGLRLSACRTLAVNNLVVIRAAGAPEDAPWVTVKVVTCNKQLNYWNVGCQFVKTPPPEVLEGLGYKHWTSGIGERLQQVRKWIPGRLQDAPSGNRPADV